MKPGDDAHFERFHLHLQPCTSSAEPCAVNLTAYTRPDSLSLNPTRRTLQYALKLRLHPHLGEQYATVEAARKQVQEEMFPDLRLGQRLMLSGFLSGLMVRLSMMEMESKD